MYRGVGADFDKPKIYFWLTMTGQFMKRGEKWFPKNYETILISTGYNTNSFFTNELK